MANLFYFRTHFDDLGLLEAVSRILRPGMTVLDVGANRGQFSLYAADRIGPEGCIHAFEPSSAAWSRFQTNLARNPRLASRILPNRTALSNEPGVAKLYQYRENSEWSSLYPHDKWTSIEQRNSGVPPINPTYVEEVPATTLEHYCAEASIDKIDLLKIDVEGFEHAVLRGATAAFEQRLIRNVVYEICTDLLDSVGNHAKAVVHILKSFGYETKRIKPSGDLESVSPGFEFPALANYLATPAEGHRAAN